MNLKKKQRFPKYFKYLFLCRAFLVKINEKKLVTQIFIRQLLFYIVCSTTEVDTVGLLKVAVRSRYAGR